MTNHKHETGTTRRQFQRMRWLAWIGLALVFFTICALWATQSRRWYVVTGYIITYGGKVDPNAHVFVQSNGRMLIDIPSQAPSHANANVYLVDRQAGLVCLAGDPFWYKGVHFAITSEAYPCEYVLNGVIEPPSFDARLKVSGNRVDFTAFRGKRVVVVRR